MNKQLLIGVLAAPLAGLFAAPAVAQDRGLDDDTYVATDDPAPAYQGGYSYDDEVPADDSYADDAEMRETQTDMVRKMNDPAFQDGMANMVGSMVGAVMSMKVGPVVDAANKMDPRGRYRRPHPNATVGDVVSRGDPYVADRVARQTRAATRSMGVMASGMARMMPVMVDMARDMGAQMEQSMSQEMRKVERDYKRSRY